jgi:hypothetical protein
VDAEFWMGFPALNEVVFCSSLSGVEATIMSEHPF